MEFIVEQKVLDLGVKIKGVEINVENNTTYSDELKQYINQHIDKLLEKETVDTIKNNQIIQGFYDLHQLVHIPRRKNLPASENLLKALIKKQQFSSINPVVDIYNIISMETKLALGAHDIDHVAGNLSLRLTQGNENFIPLGQSEAKTVPEGVYSYVDDERDIVCYLEIRQVDKTKITQESHHIFYIVQGNKETSWELIDQVAREIIDITTHFCGGEGKILESKIV